MVNQAKAEMFWKVNGWDQYRRLRGGVVQLAEILERNALSSESVSSSWSKL